jgi:hypothetical protein
MEPVPDTDTPTPHTLRKPILFFISADYALCLFPIQNEFWNYVPFRRLAGWTVD